MKLRRREHRPLSVTLREVETNRLVRIMDADDEALFRALLEQDNSSESNGGIVPGDSWGESGLVYRARRAV